MNSAQTLKGSGFITGTVKKIITGLYGGDPPERIGIFLDERLDEVLRDWAHIIEFFILTILIIMYSNRFRANIYIKVIFSFFLAVIISFIDESIQLSTPGRLFQYYDIALDTIGSFAGAVIMFVTWKIKGWNRNSKYNIQN
jgi:hypothetical protein